MKNKILIGRLAPYIAPHKHFDVTMSKYGPVYIYPADRKGECHDAEVLNGTRGIIEAVAFQMICDAMETEASHRTTPTKDEINSVRMRIKACVSGLEFEEECMEAFEQYIAQCK